MEAIRSISTSEAIAEVLRGRILGGEMDPGTRLSEARLAASFGVARPTVHTAVQTLVFEGLLRRERNRIAYVPRLTADDVRDLTELRAAIELHAVRLLVERGVRPVAAERALEQVEPVGDATDWPQAARAALEFHRGLVEAAGSLRLTAAFASLEGELTLCFAQVKQVTGALPAHRAVEHRRIFEAIVSGDADEASRLMREHLNSGISLALESP